jgi:hypothetical protein
MFYDITKAGRFGNQLFRLRKIRDGQIYGVAPGPTANLLQKAKQLRKIACIGGAQLISTFLLCPYKRLFDVDKRQSGNLESRIRIQTPGTRKYRGCQAFSSNT